MPLVAFPGVRPKEDCSCAGASTTLATLLSFCASARRIWRVEGPCFASGAYELRFGYKFSGKIIPFGAEIKYKACKDAGDTVHVFGDKMYSAIFIGYHLGPVGLVAILKAWFGPEVRAALRFIAARRKGSCAVRHQWQDSSFNGT